MRKRRWWRWPLRLALGALVVLAGVVALALVALSSLDDPRLKPHVIGAALEHGGVALDFRVLQVSLLNGTVHAEGLVFAQPERFAGHAPHWLTVGTLDGELDTRALLSGQVHVRSVSAQAVELDVVRDAESDTFGLLFPGDQTEVSEPLLLSHALGLLRGLGVEVDRATLSLTRASLTEVDGAQRVSQLTLTGLALEGHLHEAARAEAADAQPSAAESTALDVTLALRSPEGVRSQLSWMQTESAQRDADGAPVREGFEGATALDVNMALAVRDDAQLRVTMEAWPGPGLVPDTSAPLRAELLLGLAFHEDTGRTDVDLQVPEFLGGLAQGHVTGELWDDSPATLRAANGRVDAQFDELPIVLEGVHAQGLRASLQLADATLGAEGVAGDVALEATLARADVERAGPSGHVQDARLSLHTRAASSTVFDAYALELDAASFAYLDGSEPAPPSPSGSPPGDAAAAPAPPAGAAAAAVAPTAVALYARGEALALRLSGPTLDAAWISDAEASPSSPAEASATTQGGVRGSAAGTPAADVLAVSLTQLELGMGSERIALRTPEGRAEGVGLLRAVLRGAPLHGDVSLQASSLDAQSGRDRVSAAPLRAQAALHGLLLDGQGLFGLGGALDVSLDTSARFTAGGTSGDAQNLAPRLHVDLDTGELHGDVALGSLHTRERGETTLAVRGLNLAVRGEDLTSLAPPRARGFVQLEGRVGHVESGGTSLDLPRVTVDLRGRGGAYTVDLRGQVSELVAGGEAYAGTHALRATASADLRTHVYDAEAHLNAADAADTSPDLQVALHARLGADGHSIEHTVEGSARHLAALLRPYLGPSVELDFDVLHVSGAGVIVDALSSPAPAGQPLALVADLAHALRGEQHMLLSLDALRYRSAEGLTVSAPAATLDARAQQREGVTTVTLVAQLPSVEVVDGRKRANVSDLHATVGLTIPNRDEPSTAQVSLDMRVRHVGQNYLEGYPIANLHLVAAAEATPVSLTLSSLTLENPLGRSRLELRGAYEGELSEVRASRQDHAAAAIYGREALTISGTFEQDLMALSGTSFAQHAEGTLQVPMRVESGDLSTYRVSARLVARDVSLADVTHGLVVEGLEGDVPIEQVVTLTPNGPTIQASSRSNPLSRSRFPDVQPFLNRDAFLSARRIIVADQVLGPLAGNLRIDGTTLALDRLQLGYRGGVVTAQVEADVRPSAAYVTMRGNATGVRGREASDILDANFALRFAPESLALDGSLQLVRMSRSHLEALLNVLDPYREDTNMNTVRALLPFGHPRSLQARIQDGLMDLEIQLGGIASIASIQAIRAIPIAPLLDDYVAPIVDPLFREPEQDVAPRPNETQDGSPDAED